MLPNVHDTRPLPHQYSQPAYHDLDNALPKSPQAKIPRHLSQYGFNAHDVRSIPHASQQQYAYPLQRASSHLQQESLRNPGLEQANASEHMLRRKTPNGTLAAGYDGTQVEWASKSHAMKHILLPASNLRNNGSSPVGSFLPQVQNLPAGQIPTPSAMRYVPTHELDQSNQNSGWGSLEIDADLNYGSWRHPLQHSPGIDSMLNQVPIQQPQGYLLSNGHQVPTVLQPAYQSCLGPTASNDAGLYGPYWPDGAYIPYRPAALQHPRHHAPHGIDGWNEGLRGVPEGVVNGSWQTPISHGPVKSTQPVRFSQSSSSFSAPSKVNERPPIEYTIPTTSDNIATSVQQEHWSPYKAPIGHHTASFSSRSAPQFVASGGLRHATNSFPCARTNRFTSLNYDRNPILGSELHSYNTQFKEKVLTWAHGVYVDLLASLHHQKSSHHHRRGTSHQQSSRVGIYPRPPRQPGSRFLQFPNLQCRSQNSNRNSQASHGHGQDEETRRNVKPSSVLTNATANGHTRQHSPDAPSPKSMQNHDMKGHDHTSKHQQQHFGHHRQHLAETSTGLSPVVHNENQRTLRRASGASISPAHVQSPHQTTPATHAMAALEMLSKLCKDSAWQWIDGMLLGGCLAYGLGDYNKSLTWYSNILAIDPNHVEAMSNLAASLLSLNRREEAEQYWLRSVKLRPSYFEAVEHLIGLLCGDHRGKEAVNIIDFVERTLRVVKRGDAFKSGDRGSETSSGTSRASSVSTSESMDKFTFDYDCDKDWAMKDNDEQDPTLQPGFGSSGYAVPGSENGRILALVHAKGNMLYALGDNSGAAKAFEDAVLIGSGRRVHGIEGLIKKVLNVVQTDNAPAVAAPQAGKALNYPILLPPDRALQTSRLVFPHHGELPGLKDVPHGMARKAAISTTSNSLLSLAKIFQDGMSSSGASASGPKATSGVRDILALYYLSLALQPSPSTANNVGILLASVQQSVPHQQSIVSGTSQLPRIPGVAPGSGIALALAYYNYGLNLDSRHAHLYTNLGSLLKDIGQLTAAIKMYEQAVACDGHFDIALANLANAVKDQGRISDAIVYYRRAVAASPDFAEAVCGLANALNSVCGWTGRGGIVNDGGKRDRWHVDNKGMLLDAKSTGTVSAGWIKRVVDIVEKQLADGENWGKGVLQGDVLEAMLKQLEVMNGDEPWSVERRDYMRFTLKGYSQQKWEGAKVVRLVERATRRLGWLWYQEKYVKSTSRRSSDYKRPQLPAALSIPSAPTVLPFHTFTCPLSAKQIRKISQRNGLRISCSTLRAPWLPSTIFTPPAPPDPVFRVGYVSSDFNNHPLAHLMQSVFGLHDVTRVKAFCYATTASDNSIHRQHIEREAPVFQDTSSWPADRLVKQIVSDGIHILINLNGYTRGARNEVFAARPAPIQMSFMGFAGTLGAEWCDYLLADETAIPLETLRPWRRNVDLEDQIVDENSGEESDWVYSENIIFAKDTFFCCDHRQSAPDSQGEQLSWEEEQGRRWEMRKELFPSLTDDAVILGNFNQLYKIEPTTFRSWLRILACIPKAVLWLLRFPDLGESNLKQTAVLWAGAEVASRIIFTDVAPKHQHISRARVCDLFLDTPECNAHTTAADVLWSGTPLLTLPRYKYKMCSRMAASILKGALPKNEEGAKAASELIAANDDQYEQQAIRLGNGLVYTIDTHGRGQGRGRLMELRKLLYESRWTSALFDTKRWVRDLEDAYDEAWRKWVAGEGGDIWL
ncbi:MAG: hypothetical protein M1827_000878 [Pycnora praestabilis]|nr:MAG: hypothetical protein M1827_000878 [Pycnora praestabilis]